MSKQKSSIFLIYLLLNVLSINVELKALKINKLNKLQSKSLKSSTKIKTKRVFGFTNLDDHLDIWVKCSNEFETCKFSGGNRIVRYGNSPNYVYGEFTDTVSCNSNQFGVVGDFNPNKSNFCYVKNTKIEWVDCSKEYETCKFSGVSIVRYGANTNWFYKQVNNSIFCDNSMFGDPFKGTVKRCYFLRDNFWRECAKEHNVCRFSGTALVKYGVENKLSVLQVTDSVACNNTKFSDPAHDLVKTCMVRIGPTFWVECASENGECNNLPGQTILRYGANEIYYYKIVEGTVQCNNTTFGDPIYGVSKNCSYAVYNVGDESESLQNLNDSEIQKPENSVNVIEQAKCSSTDGFGFKGVCLSQLLEKNATTALDTIVKTNLSFLIDLLLEVSNNFDSCIGDFIGKKIINEPIMSDNKCNSIPIIEDFKYGIIAATINRVTCGGNPQDITFCTLFDRCGTVAIVSNAGLVQCAATYSTGIAAILSPISDSLDYVGFGFSLKRRFTSNFEICHRNGSNSVISEVTTFGHFYAKIGFTLPMADFKIAGKKIRDLFSINVECYFLIDFGNSSVIRDIINSISSTQKSDGRAFLDKILTTNSEMTLNIKGEFTLNLNSLTGGFVPDVTFEIFEENILISNGNSGASGMNRGIYFYFKNGLDNLEEVINLMTSQFKSIFSVFGVNLPVSNVNIGINFKLGYYVSDDSLGFSIKGPGFDLGCIFIYKKGGSCNFNSQFFTLLLDGLNYVLKFATKLWDTSGEQILQFSASTGKFVENATNSVNNYFKYNIKNFFERDVKKVFTSSGKGLQNFFVNDVGRGINETGSVVEGYATGTINSVGDFAQGTIGGGFAVAGSALSSLGDDIKDVFSDW